MPTDPSLLRFYHEAGNLALKSRSAKAHSALVQLEEYVDGTIIQFLRVREAIRNSMLGEEAHTKLLELYKEGKRSETVSEIRKRPLFFEFVRLNLDIHLLLVCIDKVQNLVKYITEADGDPKLNDLWKQVKPLFTPFNDARNYFEHIDERIRDQQDKLGLSSMGSGMVGSKYNEFCVRFRKRDNNWGMIMVDDSSLKLVRDAYDKLLAILKARSDRDGPMKD